MDAHEIDPATAFRAPEAIDAVVRPRRSVPRSTWNGAKAGFRWVSYIAGPISLVVAIVGLLLVVLGARAGHGWATYKFLAAAVIFYVGCVTYGVIIGGLIGLIAGVTNLAMASMLPASWRGGVNGPAPALPDSRIDGTAPVDTASIPRARPIWPWLIGVPTLLVLGAGFTAAVFGTGEVKRRLRAAEAAADRDDPYWRLDDLMAQREHVPGDENSAVVIAQALALLPKKWPEGQVRDAYDRLATVAANVQLADETAGTFRSELDTHREAVRIARTAAGYRRGRHELKLGRTLLDTPLPETQAARTAARLLAIDAAIRVQDSAPDGALESSCAILGAARSIGDEPFLISQLVRVAIGEVAMSTTRRVIGQGEPSDAALSRLQAVVLDELDQPLLLYGMKGERATLTELIRRIGAGEVPLAALSDEKFDRSDVHEDIGPWGALMFENQRAIGLEWMNRAVAIARRPPAEAARLWASWQADIDKVKATWLGLLTASLPLLMMPHVSASHSAHSRYRANLGATAILLAAERHRRKTGDWPTAIDAITPDLLPTRPVDPYSGQPFRLERRDGQIVIYSVGPNLIDEHGAYEPERWFERGHDDVGTSGWDVRLRRQPPLSD